MAADWIWFAARCSKRSNPARELDVVCPVHPNPTVGHRIRRLLGAHPRVRLTDPMPYRSFVRLLKRSALVVTDSGGIQEEAPYLGTPVLVARGTKPNAPRRSPSAEHVWCPSTRR